MVVWLIGMSGAGKTVVGKEVCRQLREKYDNIVFCDGDIFRNILGDDLGHDMKDRKRNADRVNRFCKYLSNEGVHVVFAILSVFPESRQWNRDNVDNYFEVYLKVSLDTLIKRDAKGFYAKALNGELKNVVGVDIPFPEPEFPDLIICNEGDKSIGEVAREIVAALPLR